jgi:glycosyltransferase involved in cell wall biosynthesis
MKRVVHLGPINSNGGMSSMMKLLIKNPPNEWLAESINTHSDNGIFNKLILWNESKNKLNNIIRNNKIDVAHIHVTHSMSWWRKISLKKICKKNDIPTIMHIHSGRFDDFCYGIFGLIGRNVRKNFSIGKNKVIVLENRWIEILEKWIPTDAEVIPNIALKTSNKDKIIIGKKIKILMLSRKSSGKGHLFALSVLDSLISKGVDAELMMTGLVESDFNNLRDGKLKPLGWVSEKKKEELIEQSNILLMPSAFEGSSISVIEAMINHLPCIVSPASRETVGIDELVLELNNPEEWANKILEISDEINYDRIINQIKINSEKYSIENVVNQWKIVYEKLLN